MMKAILIAGGLMLLPAPLLAQAPAPAPTEQLDPAKIAAARALIDVVMPPAEMDSLFDNAMKPMMDNMQRTIMSSPSFTEAAGKDPKVLELVSELMERSNARTLATLKQNIPGMIDAMSRAYARRFTLAEMADAKVFFATPSGKAYMQKGMTIMSDPDVLAWQSSLMQSAMAGTKSDIDDILAKVEKAARK